MTQMVAVVDPHGSKHKTKYTQKKGGQAPDIPLRRRRPRTPSFSTAAATAATAPCLLASRRLLAPVAAPPRVVLLLFLLFTHRTSPRHLERDLSTNAYTRELGSKTVHNLPKHGRSVEHRNATASTPVETCRIHYDPARKKGSHAADQNTDREPPPTPGHATSTPRGSHVPAAGTKSPRVP